MKNVTNTTEIWEENIIYTEDSKVIRQIRNWKAYKDGRIRVMATYYSRTGKVFALQFAFDKSMAKRVSRIFS